VDCIRIPVSYLLKLALADAISVSREPHPAIRSVVANIADGPRTQAYPRPRA
jgi:hypothetical protein